MRKFNNPSRRLASRIAAPDDVYVLWWCDGREVVSRVQDISMDGISIDTPLPRSAGVTTKMDFLVPEGPIRVEAVVRYAKPNTGAGLKFIAIREGDRPKLAALMTRLGSSSRPRSSLAEEHWRLGRNLTNPGESGCR